MGDDSTNQLEQTLRFLITTGEGLERDDPARAAECLRRASELARNLGDAAAEFDALVAQGLLEIRLSHLAEAEAALEHALELARSLQDDPSLAMGLNAVARLRLGQGRVDDALGVLRESIGRTTHSTGGTGALRAETLVLLGRCYGLQGETAQARRCFQEALELRRVTGDATHIGRVLNQLGNLLHRAGRYHDAVQYYREAIDHHRSANDAGDIASTANNLASTLLRLGEPNEARELFEECRDRLEQLGETGRVAAVQSNLGLLAQAQGRIDEAAECYRVSLRSHEEQQNPIGQSDCLTNLCFLSVECGRNKEAVEFADQSLAILERHGLQSTMGHALVGKALALLDAGDFDNAWTIAEEAERIAKDVGSRNQAAEAQTLRATLCLQASRLDEAVAAATESLRLAEETEDPELLATACRVAGAVRLARHELEDAKQLLAQAARTLRGWDKSYARTRVHFEEGILSAIAGQREAAAERLRRAEQGFSTLGNARWRIRTLAELAEITTDPGEQQGYRETARALAERCELLPHLAESLAHTRVRTGARPHPDRAMDGDGSAPAGASATLLGILECAIGDACESGVTAGRYLDALFAFLITTLGARSASLRLEQAVAERWRDHQWPESGRSFRLLQDEAPGDDRTNLTFIPRALQSDGDPDSGTSSARIMFDVGSTPDTIGTLVCSRSAELPFSADELDACEVVVEGLARALGGLIARAGETAAQLDPGQAERFEGLVGSSRPMQHVYRLIEQVGPSDTSVLILGNSGTGKELVARAIHARSRRRGAPFVAISCPSIPRDLIESELFGHERGAFTGAISSRAGKIELADQGTLFLDEIGDMPLATQVKILRFLQERELQRVGGHEIRQVDVRVLAATSRDLQLAMREGSFREDLYYRLNVVPIRLPDLKKRREDIALLVRQFLSELAAHDRRPPASISREALEYLMQHDWPGNVRELRNCIEYMTTVCGGNLLETANLPASVVASPGRGAASSTMRRHDAQLITPLAELAAGETLESRMMEVEAGLIRHALDQEAWNQSAAARRLGITESKIRKRMKRYGIHHRPTASSGPSGGLP